MAKAQLIQEIMVMSTITSLTSRHMVIIRLEGTVLKINNFGVLLHFKNGLFQTVRRPAEPRSSAFGNSENLGTRSFYHGAAGK